MNRNDVFVQGLLDNNNIRVNINVYIYSLYIFCFLSFGQDSQHGSFN